MRHVGQALGHAAKALVARHVLARDAHVAALGGQHAHEALEQRGFAHAIAAHDGHGLVGTAVKRDAVQRLALAVGHKQIFDFQHAMLL